jgi:hypothetical protein
MDFPTCKTCPFFIEKACFVNPPPHAAIKLDIDGNFRGSIDSIQPSVSENDTCKEHPDMSDWLRRRLEKRHDFKFVEKTP